MEASTCIQKQRMIKNHFISCSTSEEKYIKLIELGKLLEPFEEGWKTGANIVQGCQSILYLHTTVQEGKIFFKAYSEALISAGLAFLLIGVYNEESPEVVLKCSPSFIKELGLDLALSPGRSNGSASMYLRMQQEAIKTFSYLL